MYRFKTIEIKIAHLCNKIKSVVWIRIGLNKDPDPALKVNTDPDPAFEVNADPDPGYFMTYSLPQMFF